MDQTIKLQQQPMAISATAAKLAIITAVAVLVLVALLHLLSPEFDPSWRMVSEYALGNFSWVLSIMFITWAISTWALYAAIRSQVHTRAGKTGLVFLLAAGTGMAMAAVFDVRQETMHGVAGLGMPFFCIAALLVSYSLKRNPAWRSAKRRIILTAHLPWISLVLMALTMVVLFNDFSKAGIDLSSGVKPQKLPDGVTAYVGWANRLLFIFFCTWTITVAGTAIRERERERERV